MAPRLAFALVLACLVAPALGCPICDTGTGEQVRAGIADDHLGPSLLAVLLPFAVTLGVTAAIHFGFPGARNKHDHPH
jgi:hypothetical protein